MKQQELSTLVEQFPLTKSKPAFDKNHIQFQATRPEFEGDITLVVFALSKTMGMAPDKLAEEIGNYLKEKDSDVESYNIVKGFLNISFTSAYWLSFLKKTYNNQSFGQTSANKNLMLVEFASPNTNKPLHLGHMRNIFIGDSTSRILQAAGYQVKNVQVVNDRGIHICKSMLAWKLAGKNETPESAKMKGDKLVGKYYVEFDRKLKEEVKSILIKVEKGDFTLFSDKESAEIKNHQSNVKNLETQFKKQIDELDHDAITAFGTRAEIFAESAIDGNKKWKHVSKCFDEDDYKDLDEKIIEQKRKELGKILKPVIIIEDKIDEENGLIEEIIKAKTAVMQQAQEMLRKWEAGDKETRELWSKMNSWVYAGFDETYKTIGVEFDKLYYESETYLLGKGIVEEGLKKNVFRKEADHSVWCDFPGEKLDPKVLQRSDGTSLYMTQDIGTAVLRQQHFPGVTGMIYVVGNEQDHHFRVLFSIMKKLGYEWSSNLHHLSYGMVDLPSGKMKSREGTVVDADDLIDEMKAEAEKITSELGKTDGFNDAEKKNLYHTIALGALKYFILKVDPKKRMLFNPAESVDFQGNTGPFIQYTHARINSLLIKAGGSSYTVETDTELKPEEKSVIRALSRYPEVVREAAAELSPAHIANYIYDLVKTFNHFYQTVQILKEEDTGARNMRLALCMQTRYVVKHGLNLLGIESPERM